MIANGLTKERMLQIEAASVTSGFVDLNGRLLLRRHDETEFDAGSVVGPPGVNPKGAWVINTVYKYRDLVWYAGSEYLVLVNLTSSASRTPDATPSDYQLFISKGDKGDKGDKGIQGDPASPTTDAGALSSGILNNDRLDWTVSRGRYHIDGNYDWNTLTAAGVYEVAGRGANSPGAYDYGALVVSNMGNGMTEQVYYEHGGNRSIYQRLAFVSGSTWNGWVRHPQIDEILNGLRTGEHGWMPDEFQRSSLNISGQNLFNYRNSGFYRGSGVGNAPDNNWWYYQINRHDDSYVDYIATEFFGQRMFRGRIDGGGFQGWTEVITAQDSGWQNVQYAGGYGNGTNEQLQYRSKGGVIYWRGGATGTFNRTDYQTVAVNIPRWAQPGIVQRGGAISTSMRPASFEINPGDATVKLGWNVYTGTSTAPSTNPAWIAFTASYPREY